MLPLLITASLVGTFNTGLAGAHSTDVRTTVEDASNEHPLINYKIIGGTPVPANRYPYMAQVFNKINSKESIQCGGTLISPTQVCIMCSCLLYYNFQKLYTLSLPFIHHCLTLYG